MFVALLECLFVLRGALSYPGGVGAVARPDPGSGVGGAGRGLAGLVPRTAVGAPKGGGGGARGGAEGGSGLRSRGAMPPEGALGAPTDAQGPSEPPPSLPKDAPELQNNCFLLRTKNVS